MNSRVEKVEQGETGVRLSMTDGAVIEADVVVGADGIDSLVRRTLWGDSPKQEHNLYIFVGFTFDGVGVERGLCVLSHRRDRQAGIVTGASVSLSIKASSRRPGCRAGSRSPTARAAARITRWNCCAPPPSAQVEVTMGA